MTATTHPHRSLRAAASGVALALVATVLVLSAPTPAEAARPGELTGLGCIGNAEPVDSGVNNCDTGPLATTDFNALHGVGVPVVNAAGTRVYVTSYRDDAVVWFSRAASGLLTPLGCVQDPGAEPLHAGCEPAEGISFPWGVVLSPDGKQLYVASNGDSAVARLDVALDGSLSDGGCISVVSGPCEVTTAGLQGAYGLSISDDGADLYVGAYNNDGIVQLRRAPNGDLSVGSCVSVIASEDCTAAPGLDNPWQTLVSHDGKNVYVAGDIDDPDGSGGTVAVLDRDVTTGELSMGRCLRDAQAAQPAACTTTTKALAGAFDISISADDRSVYVAANEDNAVTHLRRAADGDLTDGGCVEDVGGSVGCAVKAQGLNQVASVTPAPDDDQVLASSVGDNAVTVLDRGGNGALTASSCLSDVDEGTAGCATRTEGLNGAFALAITPTGRNVYVGGGSDDALVMLKRRFGRPVTTVTASRRQQVGKLKASFGCESRCAAVVTGAVTAKTKRSKKTFALVLRRYTLLMPDQVARPVLTIKKAATLKRMLRQGASATLTLVVRTTNDGGTTTKTVKIALRS